jgi:hypothetical protein
MMADDLTPDDERPVELDDEDPPSPRIVSTSTGRTRPLDVRHRHLAGLAHGLLAASRRGSRPHDRGRVQRGRDPNRPKAPRRQQEHGCRRFHPRQMALAPTAWWLPHLRSSIAPTRELAFRLLGQSPPAPASREEDDDSPLQDEPPAPFTSPTHFEPAAPRCSLCGKASAMSAGDPCPYWRPDGQRCLGVMQ